MAEAKRTQNYITSLVIWDDVAETTRAVTGQNLTNAIAMDVSIVDGDGTQITTFGGGTQYATNVAYADGNTGTMTLAVRDDALAALTPADGDFVPLRTNSTGALHVTGGGGGTEYATNAVAPDPATGVAGLMERDDIITALTPVAGDWVRMRSSAEGALWTQDFNSDAILADTTVVAGAVAAGQMQVDIVADGAGLATSAKQLADGHNVVVSSGTITTVTTLTGTTSLTPGTAAANLGKAEDAAHSTGDVGVMALAVENEDQADLSTGDKDYTPIAVTKEGNVIVKQEGTIGVTESTPLTGFATSAKQLADGHAVTIDNIISNEVYVRGSGTAGTADVAVLTIQGIASMTPLTVTESSPISGFATSAGQLADGHNVVVSSGTVTTVSTLSAITGLTMLNAAAQITGDEASDAVDAGNPIKIGGKAQEPTAALEEVADNDRVNAAFDRQGRIATWNGYAVESAAINTSTSGDNTIVAAKGAGIRIAVLGCVIISDGTTDVRWEDGAGGTAKTGQEPLQAREGFVMPIGPQPWFVGTAATLLNLELTAAINVHGIVSYVSMTD